MKNSSILVGAAFLVGAAAASAQTDALVVDSNGHVGVGLSIIALDESLEVTAAFAPRFLATPRKCRRSIPVRIVVSDAATGEVLQSEQGRIDETSRLLGATLGPDEVGGKRVQAAVLTARWLYDCIGIDISAIRENEVGEYSVRQLILDLRVR